MIGKIILSVIPNYLKEINNLLGDERKKLPGLLLLFFGGSMLDLAGITLIGRYITLIVDPNILKESIFYLFLKHLGLSPDYQNTLIYSGLILLIFFLLKVGVAIGIKIVIFRFSLSQTARLRTKLMDTYQSMSYASYLKRNSSEFIQSTQIYTGQFVGNLQIILQLTSEGIVALAIFSLLAWTNAPMLILLIGLISASVLSYDLFFKKRVLNNGKLANLHNMSAIKGVNEGLLGLKEIRILGKEPFFREIVKVASEKYALYKISSKVIANSPRQILEFVLMFFIVLMVIWVLSFENNINVLASTMGVFGIAALRLLPSANMFNTGLSKLRFNRHGLSMIYKELHKFHVEKDYHVSSENNVNPLQKQFKNLQLSQVSFRYPNSKSWALQDVSLNIKAGESIGVIGTSGSGKTTLLDVILGLLAPQEGKLLYNGYKISEKIEDWRSNIGYLPQDVFLIDNTLRRNVTLSTSNNEIDNTKLLKAIKLANLTELVEQLPNGVDTYLGDRGVRISGGQRQRIALARAFFHDRNILLMDEATSALDNETERVVIGEIKRLKGLKTMIVVAHRLTTVQHCDRIYRMEFGRIVESGTAEQMLNLTKSANA
jgi:ATP-binding cassette, subfamily B, bacterial PglK